MKKGYLTLLNISDKEILERYAKGKESLASISKDAGCYPCTIRDRIKSYNKYEGPPNLSKKLDENKIIELYTKKLKSVPQIAIELESYSAAIRTILKKHNIKLKGTVYKEKGYIYIITNPSFPKHVKIGTSINVEKRLQQYQTYSPYRNYKIYFKLETTHPSKIEKYFDNKYESSSEWYNISSKEAKKEILNYIKNNE